MTYTDHPRALARIAGAIYLIITACALFAYMHVRGQVIVPGNMAQTAANILAHERLLRLGFAAAVVVVMCNLPLGLILYELLKVVRPRVALLALLFIIASSTLEAVNALNYIEPLLLLRLPEYTAFGPQQLQALVRGPAGSGNSDQVFSGNSDHVREGSSSDSLPPVASADEPRRRREAKEDDRSHGQASSAGVARRRDDAEAGGGEDRGVAVERAADRAGAGDRGTRRPAAGRRARRRAAERGRAVAGTGGRRARG